MDLAKKNSAGYEKLTQNASNISSDFDVSKYIKIKKTLSPTNWVGPDGCLVTTPQGEAILTYEPYMEITGYLRWFHSKYPGGKVIVREDPKVLEGNRVMIGLELYNGESLLARGYGIDESPLYAKLDALKSAMSDANFGGLDFNALRVDLPKYITTENGLTLYDGPYVLDGETIGNGQTPSEAPSKEAAPATKEKAKVKKTKVAPSVEEFVAEQNAQVEEETSDDAEESAPSDDKEKKEISSSEMTLEEAKEVLFEALPGADVSNMADIGKPMGSVATEIIRLLVSANYKGKIAPTKFPPAVIKAAEIISQSA